MRTIIWFMKGEGGKAAAVLSGKKERIVTSDVDEEKKTYECERKREKLYSCLATKKSGIARSFGRGEKKLRAAYKKRKKGKNARGGRKRVPRHIVERRKKREGLYAMSNMIKKS